MMNSNLTDRTALARMLPEEFEHSREAGYAFRRELTHTVMAALEAPAGWDMNGEFRGEFGGWFPVQVRFTPSHGGWTVAVCSPGAVSDRWLMVMLNADGRAVTVIRTLNRFEPQVINPVLCLAASLEEAGYSLAAITATLMQEAAR
nr:conjugation system SOS inhibitor PsiB [Cedecea sp. NFIX57]